MTVRVSKSEINLKKMSLKDDLFVDTKDGLLGGVESGVHRDRLTGHHPWAALSSVRDPPGLLVRNLWNRVFLLRYIVSHILDGV